MQLNQTVAAEAALHGSPLERTRIGLQALRALLHDPEDTEMVFVLAIAINRGRIGELLTQFVATETGSWLIENRPAIDSTALDYDWLRGLPKKTLGRHYVRFLDDNGLDADFFNEPPALSPTMRYIAKRMRQSHDLWHTVTGCGTSPAGEVELQAFTYAQVDVPSSGLIALTGSIRGLREDLSMPLRTIRAYRRGLRAEKLAPFLWENYWEHPIDEVRAVLGIE